MKDEMKSKKVKNNTEITWKARGPFGSRKRTGIVRKFVKAGTEIVLPRGADETKLKAEFVNTIHDRYLVEIQRRHGRTGAKIASLWMAPKAATINDQV